MRAAEIAAAVLICLGVGAAAAPAGQVRRFDVPAGTLGAVIFRLADQADISIGLNDPALAGRPTGGVRGTMTVDRALRAVLGKCGCMAEQDSDAVYRIVPSPAAPKRPVTVPAAPASADDAVQDIVVTASKQRDRLESYPGSVDILQLGADRDGGERRAQGSEVVVQRLPTVSSTNLGPGRNKLFIRGIADSSFTGSTQATVGEYLGDVRLTYSAPDPDLYLYDVARVEVLEGPQGTLYGTGALGGIVRIVPEAPAVGELKGSAELGGSNTWHGGAGSDAAAMLNVPLVGDQLTVRAVAYGSQAPGYIDDIGRSVGNVNRTRTIGGRAVFRIEAGGGWTVDAGAAVQDINSRDGQYAERGLPPLTRASTLAQPFDNDYALADVTIRKSWGALDLVSATGVVDHDLTTDFDATGFAGTTGAQLFTDDNRIKLVSHETRLSGPAAGDQRWLLGVSAVYVVDKIRRTLGPPDAPVSITGVRNQNVEAALFGQYGIGITGRLSATVGGRATYSQAEGQPLDLAHAEALEDTRHALRVLPSIGLAWTVQPGVLLFARYQEGNRAGGLAVSAVGASTSVQRFETDSVGSFEGGLRLGRRGSDTLSGSLVGSWTKWKDIQADLVDSSGLPTTANIGDGRIAALEAEIAWTPLKVLTVSGGLFLTDSGLTKPDSAFVSPKEMELPNVAEAGGRLAFAYAAVLSPSATLTLDGDIRYVGRSLLGVAAPLDIRQGGYIDTAAGMRLALAHFGISLDMTNLTDNRSNIFAFGNPFTVDRGNQVTPLRPRTVRLGLDARF